MYPNLKKQANLTSIAAGAVCTAQLPAEGVHHGLHLVFRKAAGVVMSRAEIIADVGLITLRLSGDIKIEATATQLLDLFKYWWDKDGAFTVAGALPIPFVRPMLLPAAERSLLAWGMADVSSYTIELNVTGVVTLVSIEVWCEIEQANRNLGRHLCIAPFAQTFATTGKQEISTLPFGDPDVGIVAHHIGESTGDIDWVTIKASGNDVFDEVPMELNNHRIRQAGRSRQADYYHVDYSIINDKTGYLPSGILSSYRQSIFWEVAGGAPSNYTILNEEIRGLQQPVA